ncbi:MAG: hypothetical protein ACW98Y_10410 [Candidatus Thorarchaeota archaeon]|jgi:hypothetical protein
MTEIENPKSNQLSLIVLFGLLSVICAEVFSGSAPLWMYELWGLFVVLPLYWGHGLILWNIAVRYHKTSVTHLYLLGIIYGLYESWMTKVIWAGYMGQNPQFGQLLGFATGEFLIIALFWHAVFSFIVPIIAFQLLGNKDQMVRKSKLNVIIFGFIILIPSIFIPSGLNFDFIATLLSFGTNTILLVFMIYIAKKLNPNGFTLDSLRLGKKGMGITIGYTAFLYVFLLIILFPERIAPPFTLLLTVLFYALVIALFYFSEERTIFEESVADGFSSRHIAYGFAAIGFLILSWFLILFTTIPNILGIFLYLGMMIAGPCLFIVAVVRVFTRRH